MTPRERLAASLLSAAAKSESWGDARASIAAESAALLSRDTGNDPRHTLLSLFIAANEAAAIARRASLEGARNPDHTALVSRGRIEVMRAAIDALTNAVDALDAHTFAGSA